MEITEAVAKRRSKLFARLFAIGSPSIFVLATFANQVVYLHLYQVWVLGIVYVLACLWVASLIAKMAWKKGRSWNAFFALSLFFPVIAWIVAAVVSTDQATAMSGTKKCPKCAELIKQEATLCKHCGSEV
jgi:hypothetical protein